MAAHIDTVRNVMRVAGRERGLVRVKGITIICRLTRIRACPLYYIHTCIAFTWSYMVKTYISTGYTVYDMMGVDMGLQQACSWKSPQTLFSSGVLHACRPCNLDSGVAFTNDRSSVYNILGVTRNLLGHVLHRVG